MFGLSTESRRVDNDNNNYGMSNANVLLGMCPPVGGADCSGREELIVEDKEEPIVRVGYQ